ncbi:MAG: HIT family protein [Ktedonobacterales bacterium]
MDALTDCILCQPLVESEVWVTPLWRVAVNRNQNLLGKCFIALRRHDEDICNLTEDEVSDLWETVRSVKGVLVARFQPDHFNYAFLMNQDRHVHLHVMPRYQAPRSFAGVEFEDSDAIEQRRLPDSTYLEIVAALREGFAGNFI